VIARHVAWIALPAAAGALAAWLGRDRLPPGGLDGAFLGIALAAAGAVSWILCVGWSITQGPRTFMAATVLGILGRLVVYGATLLYVGFMTTIDLRWTAGALLGFYLVFMVVEVRFALARR
jgi:hypothetical protein